LSRKSKRNDILNYEKKVLEAKHDSVFWSFVNSTLSAKSRNIPPLKCNGETLLDDFEKAETFSDHFSSIFRGDDGKRLDLLAPYPKVNLQVNFGPDVVYWQLRKLKGKRSMGPEGLPSFFFKRLAAPLALPLSIIMQHSMLTGSLPEYWTKAIVVPIFKNKGSNSDPKMYRPISLTSPACKVTEKLIRAKMLAYIDQHQIFTPAQHGFFLNGQQ
jgi:hypothetical protein